MQAGDLTSKHLGKTLGVQGATGERDTPEWVIRGKLVEVRHRLDGPPGQEGTVTVLVTLKVGPTGMEVTLSLGEPDSVG